MPRPSAPLDRVLELCERFYQRDGFVKWSDVGKALGVSRQAVQLRLSTAVARGDITPETVERYQSMSSRHAASRERRETTKRESGQYRLQARLLPENHAWLLEEATFRKVTTADVINGLITRERERRQ